MRLKDSNPASPEAPHPGHGASAGQTERPFAFVCSNPVKLCTRITDLVWTFQHMALKFLDASPLSRSHLIFSFRSAWASDYLNQSTLAEAMLCDFPDSVVKGQAVSRHV